MYITVLRRITEKPANMLTKQGNGWIFGLKKSL